MQNCMKEKTILGIDITRNDLNIVVYNLNCLLLYLSRLRIFGYGNKTLLKLDFRYSIINSIYTRNHSHVYNHI